MVFYVSMIIKLRECMNLLNEELQVNDLYDIRVKNTKFSLWLPSPQFGNPQKMKCVSKLGF